MILELFFDNEDAAILEKAAKLNNMDVTAYLTHAFKWQIGSDLNAKRFHEEYLKLEEEFPVHDELFEKKLQALEEKYKYPDE